MAVNFPDANASYSFQRPQLHAMHMRLTPEVKDALLRAKQSGEQASLRLTGTGSGNAITVGGQTYDFHPPTAQERLDVFTQSKQGCMQVGQIHQKAVIKRSMLQSMGKQPVTGQAVQHQGPHQIAHRASAGPGQNGRTQQPVLQPVRKQHQTGAQPQAVQKPSTQPKPAMAPPQEPRLSHAAGLTKQTAANRPTPASGSHPSSAHPTPAAHQHQGAQSHPPAHPSQHAAAGVSNQSAQTAMAAPKPAKGKAGKAPGTAASSQAQSKEVLEQVYAAAKKGQKEAMLVALLQCRPPKHHVLEAVFKDTEKKVAGFQRLQGESFKNACRKYAEMKSGNVLQLRGQFLTEAQAILASLSPPTSPSEASGLPAQLAQASGPPAAAARRGNAEPEAARQRKKSAEPQAAPQRHSTPDPQGMNWGGSDLQAAKAADKGKKRKRLTKAADLGRGPDSIVGNQSPGAGMKRKMQVAGLTDSESGEDGIAVNRQSKAPKVASNLRPPTYSGAHPSTMTAGPVPQLQQQPAGLNGLSEQHHHSQGQQWQGEDEAPGNGTSLGVQDFRAGSLGAEGRSASLEAPMSSGDRGQAAAAAPSVGKIKLKIRRPWSAGADEYDESWFAEHVGRQPNLRGPIATTDQWEGYVQEYNSKHALYFRLHQEMQDTKVKVEGLQQAIHRASSDTEKTKYEQQFKLMWTRREPRTQKWDQAFTVLHQELETLHKHLQAFHDQHVGRV